jgi:hypothetical protein
MDGRRGEGAVLRISKIRGRDEENEGGVENIMAASSRRTRA